MTRNEFVVKRLVQKLLSVDRASLTESMAKIAPKQSKLVGQTVAEALKRAETKLSR